MNVRGVKALTLKLLHDRAEPMYLSICPEYWIMTPVAAILHGFVFTVSVVSAFNVAYGQGYFTDTQQQHANDEARVRDWLAEKAVTEKCSACYTSCCRWWLINFIVTILTVADLSSDILYTTTVPLYNDAIKTLLIVSLAATHVINLGISCGIAADAEEMLVSRILMFFDCFVSLGTANYHIFTIRRKIRRQHSYSSEAKYLNGFILAAAESLP